MSLGHFIENTSRDKPCQKCQGKGDHEITMDYCLELLLFYD